MNKFNHTTTEIESCRRYWQQKLESHLSLLELPTDYPVSSSQNYVGGKQSLVISQSLTQTLASLSEQQQVDLFMTVLTAINILLYRYTSQEDMIISVAENDHVCADLIELLPLCTNIASNSSFKELLKSINDIFLQAKAHQYIALDQLLSDLNINQDLPRNPLFQVGVIYQESKFFEQTFVEIFTEFDLLIYIQKHPQQQTLSIDLIYNQHLFSTERMAEMLHQLDYLLIQIASQPDNLIQSYSLATPETKNLLPNPQIPLTEPIHEPITSIFTHWANSTPEQPAIIQDTRLWTYGELGKAAEIIAQTLLVSNVKIGDVVAVYGSRSFGLIASMLGVLMSGGVLLTLAANLPEARQKLMLNTAKAQHLLYVDVEGTENQFLIEESLQIITINPHTGKPIETPDISNINYPVILSPDHAAYIFFTSGTTGVPKGVLGCHKGLSHFLNWQRQTFAITPEDRAAQLTGLSFDVVLRDIFLPLTSGATLCLPVQDDLSSAYILPWLEEQQISLLHTVPTLAQSWLMNVPPEVTLRSLRRIFFAGEPLTDTLIYRWRSAFPAAGAIINLYGPTETTLAKCFYPVPAEHILPGVQPVGSPLPQTQALILTSNHQLCGIGESGEIVIRTPFRSKGYINASPENLSRFRKNPFREDDADLCYYTGDRGRYRPEGNIEILGRIDDQVKIRGVRIEPGEIGALLGKHPQIQATVVIASPDQTGDKRLVAYFVPKQQPAPTSSALRQFLKQQLPDYMIPSAFVMLESLPLTANGKVDRRNLPKPDYEREISTETLIAPRTPQEITLVKIWETVLGIQPIGIEDNFFDLGGHSLLATQIISACYQAFDVRLSMRQFFITPTISQLAIAIQETPQQGQDKSNYQNISKVANRELLPLSLTQMSLWFLEQLESHSSGYQNHIYRAVHLKGDLNIIALQSALDSIVIYHESLRTNFVSVDGNPRQVIGQPRPVELLIVDLPEFAEPESDIELQKYLKQQIQRPFNLAKDLMLRGNLLQIAPQEHILLLVMHHIATDGWSVRILLKNLQELYTAFCNNQPNPLPILPIQYADFAVWQRQWLLGQESQQQIQYWQQQLAATNPLLALPTDYPRPPVQSYAGATQSIFINESLSTSLKALARQEGCTLFMILLAAFKVLLYRYSRQEDIIVASPIAGRNSTEIENIIGLFINIIILRTDLSENPTFRELLGRLREVSLAAYAHQDISAGQVVETLKIERSLSYNPLFQVMFILQHPQEKYVELSDLKVTPINIHSGISLYDLTLEMQETPTGIHGFFEYRTDLFTAETISRMVGHFQTLLTAIVTNPEQRIVTLPLLKNSERQQLLLEWNNTVVDYPQQKRIHQLFAEQVAKNPQAIAVVCEDGQLTYQELNIRANQLANYLNTIGISAEMLVGICVQRSLEMVVGFLGILKAGAAYLPLDPSYPAERLAFMLEDSQATVILTQQPLLTVLPTKLEAQIVCLDTDWQKIVKYSPENPTIQPGDLAYIIYTSGSTGKPKGVMINHQGLVNHNLAMAKLFDIKPQDRMLQSASISFDMAVEEIFPTLISGATLVLRNEEMLLSIRKFQKFVEEKEITILDLPTALWHQIVSGMQLFGDYLPKSVRLLIVGGEKASLETYQQWQKIVGNQCRWINTYGPTETTIVATVYEPNEQLITTSSLAEIPIGRPIANTKTYILDPHLQPVPIGVPGELYIGGAGLARGYLNRADLTAERFISNPFIVDTNLYKTGDLVRYLKDGNIEFIGRIDDQVKIRGFRIELAEIETLLCQHPDIIEAVVIVQEKTQNDQRLVAYIVPNPQQKPTITNIKQFLAKKLPDYMLPAVLIMLDSLPLTPNGKINRQALPLPEYINQETNQSFVAPRDQLETQLTKIWEEIIGVNPIGIEDNFFALGGHSLIALRLFNEIEKIYGKTLPLATLFQTQTVAELATILRQEGWSAPWSSLIQIKAGGSKSPLFCIHPIGGNILEYQVLVNYLGEEQPIYGLQSPGLDGKQEPLHSIEAMATHYIQQIKTVQPQGSYFLFGYSFGGLVAFEIAQQLSAQGEEVAFLGILDRTSPTLAKVRPSFLKSVKIHLTNLWQLKPKQKVRYIRDRIEYNLMKVTYRDFLLRELAKIETITPQLLRVLDNNLLADKNYEPKVYSGKIHLFRSQIQSLENSQHIDLGWSDLVKGDLEIHHIACEHMNLLREPYVKLLADSLQSALPD